MQLHREPTISRLQKAFCTLKVQHKSRLFVPCRSSIISDKKYVASSYSLRYDHGLAKVREELPLRMHKSCRIEYINANFLHIRDRDSSQIIQLIAFDGAFWCTSQFHWGTSKRRQERMELQSKERERNQLFSPPRLLVTFLNVRQVYEGICPKASHDWTWELNCGTSITARPISILGTSWSTSPMADDYHRSINIACAKIIVKELALGSAKCLSLCTRLLSSNYFCMQFELEIAFFRSLVVASLESPWSTSFSSFHSSHFSISNVRSFVRS